MTMTMAMTMIIIVTLTNDHHFTDGIWMFLDTT